MADSEETKVWLDAKFFGIGFMREGKHIPLKDIYMADSIIERAAAALRDAEGCGYTLEETEERVFCDDPRLLNSLICSCRDSTRAVLKAIRHPSHAMCIAGDPKNFAPGDSEAIWTAMIDEALSA